MSDRQKKVDRYLRAANIGTAAAIAFPFLHIAMGTVFLGYEDGDDLIIPALLFLAAITYLIAETYSIFYVFLRRKTDEFTLAMFHSGTTYAFFAAILWLVLGGYVEIFIDGMVAGEAYEAAKADGVNLNEIEQVESTDIIGRFAASVILAAFFIGFQIKRIRG
ncbi:hypothetical protein [Erythrobacter crassostreae]|uniref:Uncharacterized protein n=1 Tax=Erythrobacter crassostreae TaxID=2828328 RepID=A0A9X1F621_9SPHN|nr:hypothetical protein [Erythrobacter crassostrea]MBV7259953.1 hypothetical protein [Erythrobacter crassostrea]